MDEAVFLGGNDPKIAGMIVCLVPIYVMYLLAGLSIGHKTMLVFPA